MFYESTAVTSVSDDFLPAASLADYCYFYMFYGCSNLTTAPELPASTLAKSCYERMFTYCRSLNSVKISYTGRVDDAPNRAFTSWVVGVASSGTFYYRGSQSTQSFGFPSGWSINPN